MHFYALVTISLLSVLATRRALTATERLPYDVYIGFYTLTSTIGAMIMGLPSTQEIWFLYSLTTGMDVDAIDINADFKYWFLILSPYIIPGPVIVLVKYALGKYAFDRLRINLPQLVDVNVGRLATLAVLSAMVLFCLYQLYSAGLLGKTLISASRGINYQANILNRVDVFRGVGSTFFGFAYAGIPALAAYALYRYLEDRAQKSWLLISILSSGSAIYFYLSSFQKSYTLLLLILLGLVLMERRLISYKRALIAGGVLFLLLIGMNFMLVGTSTLEVLATGLNLVFRMPAAFPFYIGLYPDVIPHAGLDIGLQKFNIGPSSSPNLDVMNYMFPHTVYVQGAAPAPAQLTAYAEGGVSWSIITLMMVGGVIGIAGRIGQVARSAFGRTLFVCLCISIYYMTQSGFWLTLQGSYGFFWALFSLFAIVATEHVLATAVLHERRSRQGV